MQTEIGYGVTKRATLRGSRRAASSVEYAVAMTIVISGAALIAQLGQRTFRSVETLTKTNLALADSRIDSGAATLQQTRQRTRDPWKHMLLVVAGVAMSCVMLARRAMRRKNVESTEEESTPTIDAGEALRDALFAKRSSLMQRLSKDLGSVLNSRIEVHHLMSEDPKVVEPTRKADDVRRLMRESRMHHLMVCDDSRLVGVISDRDLANQDATTAAEFMTADPITVTPTTLLIPTVSTMINKRISCLPVAEDGILRGVLTRTDLLIAYQCMLHIMSKLLNENRKSDTMSFSAESMMAMSPDGDSHPA